MGYHIIRMLACIAAIGAAYQNAAARPRNNKRNIAAEQIKIEWQYLDSLQSLRNKYDTWKNAKADTLSNPYYFQLFSPGTYFSNVVRQQIGNLPNDSTSGHGTAGSISGHAASIYDEIGQALLHAYSSKPQLIQSNIGLYETNKSDGGIREDVIKEVKPHVKLADKVSKPNAETHDDFLDNQWNIIIRKPNFWNYKANLSLQFMQNYVSSNWYKGGESTYSMLAATTIEANYNNKQKLTFDNRLEMKLGFQNSKNDDTHKYKTNNDLLRLTNKLGIRAAGNWYYTLLLQSWTQFYHGYKSNDTKIYSDFMSPFESLFSIGMDYKLNKPRFTLNATISPLALDFKYVGRSALATSFGLKEGRHTKYECGSNITMNYNWKICKNVNWKGRIYYYTNYKKTQIEWENTFSLIINQYLSSTLFVYPRFDDSVSRGENESYIQFNQWLSLGLNVNF